MKKQGKKPLTENRIVGSDGEASWQAFGGGVALWLACKRIVLIVGVNVDVSAALGAEGSGVERRGDLRCACLVLPRFRAPPLQSGSPARQPLELT
eukprot:scaffold111_cov252-Pinguiococcus_pyrenoidosus.AAC.23